MWPAALKVLHVNDIGNVRRIYLRVGAARLHGLLCLQRVTCSLYAYIPRLGERRKRENSQSIVLANHSSNTVTPRFFIYFSFILRRLAKFLAFGNQRRYRNYDTKFFYSRDLAKPTHRPLTLFSITMRESTFPAVLARIRQLRSAQGHTHSIRVRVQSSERKRETSCSLVFGER